MTALDVKAEIKSLEAGLRDEGLSDANKQHLNKLKKQVRDEKRGRKIATALKELKTETRHCATCGGIFHAKVVSILHLIAGIEEKE